jgi:DNA adenine methylase
MDYQKEYKAAVTNKIKSDTLKAFKYTAGEFISWMGGKTTVADQLSAFLQKIPHSVFVDSFFGGGAEFWAKSKSKYNIINDKNDNLFNLLDVVSHNLNDLLFFIFHTVKSAERFKQWKKLYASKDWKKIDKVERAGIYLYLIFFSVNNDENAMGFSYSRLQTGVSYGSSQMYVRLIRACEKLQGVSIFNQDFSWIVKKFNNDKWGTVLFFFDPPYVKTDTGLYYKHSAREGEGGMTLHRRLFSCCKEIDEAGNYFFITYDDAPIVRTMYKGFNIIPFEITYGSNSKTATEIIVTNSTYHKQLDLF